VRARRILLSTLAALAACGSTGDPAPQTSGGATQPSETDGASSAPFRQHHFASCGG